jgi:hypothetical protein
MIWFMRFTQVMEEFPVAVFLSLPDKERGLPIIYSNSYTEQATGYCRDDLHGKENLFFSGACDEVINALVGGVPSVSAHTIRYKDGTDRAVTIVSKPIYDFRSNFRYNLSVQIESSLLEDLRIVTMLVLSVSSIISSRA